MLRCSSHTMQCDLQDDQNLKFFLSLLEELLGDTLSLEVESGSSLWEFYKVIQSELSRPVA